MNQTCPLPVLLAVGFSPSSSAGWAHILLDIAGESGLGEWPAIIAYVGASVALGAIGLPPATTVVTAGLLWPFPEALAIALACGMGASVCGFLLARHLARGFLSTRLPRRLQSRLQNLERRPLLTVILLRLTLFLFPPVNWMFGLSQMRLRTYTVGTLIGVLPETVLLTLCGRGLAAYVLREPAARFAVLGTMALGTVLLYFGTRRREREAQ